MLFWRFAAFGMCVETEDVGKLSIVCFFPILVFAEDSHYCRTSLTFDCILRLASSVRQRNRFPFLRDERHRRIKPVAIAEQVHCIGDRRRRKLTM